jgi:phage gpG-like protein
VAEQTFTVEITGIPQVTRLLAKFGDAETRRTLHQRWGIQGMNWVDENFRKQGALTGSPWAALRPSTIARRRNKKKESILILQDSGALRGSYVMKYDENSATVGSPKFYSIYHEEGRAPWAIRPTTRVIGEAATTITGNSGMHPGLPQRRMLPRQTDATFMDKMKKVAVTLFNQLSKK